MKLTKTVIDKTNYNKVNNARQFLWDSDIPGFGVRIYPSNKRTFILSYNLNGRKRLLSIGAYGVLTLDQARIEARRLQIKIYDGIDPLADKKREIINKSMKKLVLDFLEKHSKVYKKSWEDDRRRIETYIIPQIGQFQANSIVKSDVVSLHQKIGKHSIYEANRTLSLLGTALRFGRDWGFLDPSAALPTQGIKKFKEVERDRWVTPQEMPKLAESIDKEDSPYVKAAIWLYLLTGLRKTELLESKWTNIDWVRKEIKIEDTKNGHNHYVPLSESAIEILKSIPALENNEFIIVGKNHGSHLVNISKAWTRIKKRAGVDDVRLHDLRRTTGSWLAQTGNSLHLIGKVLNHRSSNTTKIYARFAQDHVRDALEEHGEKIKSFMIK